MQKLTDICTQPNNACAYGPPVPLTLRATLPSESSFASDGEMNSAGDDFTPEASLSQPKYICVSVSGEYDFLIFLDI